MPSAAPLPAGRDAAGRAELAALADAVSARYAGAFADGLRAAGPLDIGPLGGGGDSHGDGAADAVNGSGSGSARAGWMDVVRPALQRRMRGMGPGMLESEAAGHIQYNLLAIVDDAYPRASDAMEMLKRQRAALERRLDDAFPAGGAGAGGGGWADKVRDGARVLRVSTLQLEWRSGPCLARGTLNVER